MDQAREEMARRWQRLDAILTIGGSKNKKPVKGRSGRLYKWHNIGGVQCLAALYVCMASFNTLAGWRAIRTEMNCSIVPDAELTEPVSFLVCRGHETIPKGTPP